ncbi:Rhodanese-like domain containing protein [Trichomonas vaginalis G3]|uniref:protein-tyrosine-phosphatase n=1 Tax=Trichomonas vaginalis (strain ATCC PRA-98 / G3) TaxID=412133 RepID=A2G462_TRIV3|nr:positive regulation of cell cycle G2/M phase transition [Trichomonas vaginalis G3]EAX88050.1 Rhodanese-like domain containing protein [Trichomonas vaginalis G3]KAI5551705.1 positive regulation of cell cycle G2/M phase transition [Trichomonas vaginalis G3]|eukprot:XP_001300980.1 Rhodanese-like domain containing protein [Trichomonas vaginalis G3]
MLTCIGSSKFKAELPLPDFDDICNSPNQAQFGGILSEDILSPSLLASSDNQRPFKTLTPKQLAQLINDPFSFGFNQVVILDARFEYEFHGGRIVGARNIRSKSQMIGIYERFLGQNVCIVVHCEFSQNRGPTLLSLFREYDRHHNSYPNLSYPNTFLLEGGYRRFYEEMPDLCIGGYVPMREERFVNNGELRRSHSFYAREMLQQKRPARPKLQLVRCSSQSTDHWSTLFGEYAASAPTSPSALGNCFSYSSSQ